jgi:3-methyladenine DNA glycosylase/8-oxoguanine DNA glycosylase
MNLSLVETLIIEPTIPFDFDGTFHKPDHFTTDDHEYVKGIRWQTMNWNGIKLGLKISNIGKVDEPLIKVDIYAKKKLDKDYIKSFENELIYRFNLDLNIKDFYDKFGKHPSLKDPIKNLYGMRPGHPSSLYEYLVIGVILQNASVKRSIQMFRNLLSKYGEVLEFDGKKLYCLWDVGRFKDVDEQELRDLKVGYRAKSIKRLDQEFYERNIEEKDVRKMSLDEQKDFLISLYGIGPATVWYILFDVFHRWDVFEHISPWEQKLYSQLFFGRGLGDLATVEELLEFINDFKEYKQLAVHYMWEDLWWRREGGEAIEWLEKEIRA